MMILRTLLLGMAAALCLALPGRAEPTMPCSPAEDTASSPTPLPHVATGLRPGGTLNVLAVGSANLFKPEASFAPGSLLNQSVQGATQTSVPPAQVMTEAASSTSFPQQMAAALEKLVPGTTVRVTTRGGRGLSATDQLALLTDLVAKEQFQLVLWQTGTVEAVRNLPPSEFAQTLTDGVEKATRSGADIVLIDPQFSRFLQTNSNIEPYEQAFQTVASIPNVAFFRRFDMMRNWVGNGQIDLERTPKAGRLAAVEHLHECLGRELARLIYAGARS